MSRFVMLCYSLLAITIVHISTVEGFPSNKVLSRAKRIISGSPASIKDWPYIAHLHFLQPKPKFKVCAAVVIDRMWVLTVSHCVLDIKDKPQYLTVGVGRTRRSDVYHSSYNLTVSKIIIHPKYEYLIAKINNALLAKTYNQFKGSFDYDIAMLRLSAPIPVNTVVRPIDIVKPNADVPSNFPGSCRIAGWGSTKQFTGLSQLQAQNYSAPSDLTAIFTPMVTNQECRRNFKVKKSNVVKEQDITDRIMCAGDITGGNGSGCMGDSGAPLVCKDANGRNFLCGLLVTGNSECKPGGYHMVFTRVSYYSDWLYKTMHIYK